MIFYLEKKIISALVIFQTFISCNCGNLTNSLHKNINGPNQSDSKQSIIVPESKIELFEITSNTNLPPSPEAIPIIDTANQLKFNYTDSSEAAVMKLEAMINLGNFVDVFGKSFDDLHSNIKLNGSVEVPEGLLTQQSNSQSFRANQKEASSDTFFYVSNPDQHTSQNCYIVKIKSSVSKTIFEKLHEVFGLIEAKVYKKYKHGFLGYSICFPENTLPLALMREIPSIEFIERDNIIKAAQIQDDAPWGLARLSSPSPKSSFYSFDGTGQGVTVYVVDSGLYDTKGK
jgi:hypothetical protein